MSTKKNQPNRSSRLAGFRQHIQYIYECLVLLYYIDSIYEHGNRLCSHFCYKLKLSQLSQISNIIILDHLKFGSFFINSASFWRSWKSISWIIFKFCTQIAYYEKTLNPKFQAPLTSGVKAS